MVNLCTVNFGSHNIKKDKNEIYLKNKNKKTQKKG